MGKIGGKYNLDMNKGYDLVYNYIQKEYYQTSIYGLNFYDNCYLSNEFRYYIELWELWYAGYVAEFHQYRYYNGSNEVQVDKKHLNMAKKVCEDKATLLLNEKFCINLDNENDSDFLQEVLNKNRFYVRGNETVEKANAVGTAAFVEYMNDEDIIIDYVSARNIIPITVVNGEVINCAFVCQTKVGDDTIFYLQTHILVQAAQTEKEMQWRMENKVPVEYEGYLIENRTLKQTGSELVMDDKYMGEVEGIVMTNMMMPCFQIIKPNLVNNVCLIDSDNGMGISCFANAADVLESVDNAYENLDNEIQSGRKRLIIHDKLAKVNTAFEGQEQILKPVFDRNDTTFFAMDMEGSNELIKSIDSTLRIQESVDALNMQLSVLSMRCGLGNNYYKFESGVLKTATEIISDNNPLYRTIKRDELLLKDALINMTKAILLMGGRNIEQDINVMFDDSIFEDTNTIRKNKMLEYSAGIIDKIQYMIDVYKMTEEQAIDFIQKIEARTPQEMGIDMIQS